MIKLYDFALSGNCHKVRMMLALLGVPYERVDIDLTKKDQMADWFVAINPLHKVPVLDDSGLVLRDSAAILLYLARQYGKPEWAPTEPRDAAEVQQWLSLSVNEVFNGLAMARAIIIFKRDMDHAAAVAVANTALDVMENRLSERDWLALDRFTIADLACYPYAALAHEGQMDLTPYPAIRRWFKRIEALPDYVAMRGLPHPQARFGIGREL